MKNKKTIILFVLLIVKLLIISVLFSGILSNSQSVGENPALCASVWYSSVDTVSADDTEETQEGHDVFTRFKEWFDENRDEIISVVGVIMTLIIIPLVKGLANRSDKVSNYVGDMGKEVSKAVDCFKEGADKLQSVNELSQNDRKLFEELQSVRAELMVNKEQLNALLNSVYTAFMGSNVSDGVKGILSEYMRQAMSFRGESQIAMEKLEKTKELLGDVAEAVDDANEILGGKRPIDR